MRKINHLIAFVILLISPALLQAQEPTQGFDHTMRSNGRIYVVVAVILVILAGLILYMVRIDGKIRKIEKNN